MLDEKELWTAGTSSSTELSGEYVRIKQQPGILEQIVNTEDAMQNGSTDDSNLSMESLGGVEDLTIFSLVGDVFRKVYMCIGRPDRLLAILALLSLAGGAVNFDSEATAIDSDTGSASSSVVTTRGATSRLSVSPTESEIIAEALHATRTWIRYIDENAIPKDERDLLVEMPNIPTRELAVRFAERLVLDGVGTPVVGIEPEGGIELVYRSPSSLRTLLIFNSGEVVASTVSIDGEYVWEIEGGPEGESFANTVRVFKSRL